MTAITIKKSDLKHLILEAIEKHIEAHPQEAKALALSACTTLANRMTLTELEHWHGALWGLYK